MKDVDDQNPTPALAVENDVGCMLEAAIFVKRTPEVGTLGQQSECFFKCGEVGIRLHRTEVLESVTVNGFQLAVRTACQPIA